MIDFCFRESNCFMVHSKAEDKIIERMLSGKEPIVVTESQDNVVDTAALQASRLTNVAEVVPETGTSAIQTDDTLGRGR